jgi:hypothetical protein
MSQIGVNSTGSRRHALRNGDDQRASLVRDIDDGVETVMTSKVFI